MPYLKSIIALTALGALANRHNPQWEAFSVKARGCYQESAGCLIGQKYCHHGAIIQHQPCGDDESGLFGETY